jgi:hypothetical protein
MLISAKEIFENKRGGYHKIFTKKKNNRAFRKKKIGYDFIFESKKAEFEGIFSKKR